MDYYEEKWVLWFARHGAKRWAITLGQRTFYSVKEWEVSTRWKRHEDCHKRQFMRDGWVKFLSRYIYEGLTKGYLNISYEIEARSAEME